jgi:hypothetical protein
VVLGPADRVVLERHATRGDLGVQLPVRVAVEVGEGDPVGRRTGRLEQVDDLVTRGADLGVHEDRRARASARARDRLQAPPLGRRDVVVGGATLDRACPCRVQRQARIVPVRGMHARSGR